MIQALELAREVLTSTATYPDAAARKEAMAAVAAIEAALADVPAVVKLSQFGLETLRVLREKGSPDFVDFEGIALSTGVEVVELADQPCGPDCACADFGAFPQGCQRLEPCVAALLAAKEPQR